MPLERFFDTMGPFLAGAIDVDEVTARLGPSPSGRARLGLYPELVRRQRRGVLDGLFVGVRAACARMWSGLWDEIATEYVRVHPPLHWEPNHFGEAMSGFVAARRAQDSALPAYLEELADYEFVRFLAGVHDDRAEDAPVPERGIFARHYEHDVVGFVERVESFGSVDKDAPALAPQTIVVCWSSTRHRVLTLRASAEALVAIARRSSQPVSVHLDPDAVARAEAHLVSVGIIPPRSNGK